MSSLSAAWVSPDVLPIRMTIATLPNLTLDITASENFTKGNRFGFFPSVAVGYMLSEEKFMEKYKDTFSKIKFRASWGLTGNDQLDGRRFAFLPTIDTDGSYKWGVNNDYNRASRFEGEFGVMNLTWETVEKLNVGTEIGLWNALDLQVDWFKRAASGHLYAA